ncbi:carbohydrate kinase family protein [Flavobacterium sp. CYK-55]|uniref:carbohydrate kinase family protein n=1 Tax=Flavobacterium sp. CYK-55 TaxID=2835529 RepID=UPI001BCFCBF8|nr:carbohydrate kinase family protein [Flavobacterium sp. CYK-55]MBS7785888.1 carbohydrate kinase family protein [Flavobacterium sp. CYK-55]
MNKSVDIICVGEVLIDFIGHEISSLDKTKDFHRFLGGSPTNVAVNAARLGLKSALVATSGSDGFGDYIHQKLHANQVLTTYMRKSLSLPTSVIFVSRSTQTPEFIPFREADREIIEDQLPDALLENAKIFHTTCFALSKDPARMTILNRAHKAKSLGLQMSIDINYSEKIWPNRYEAHQILKDYLSTNPLVKVSDDDCMRLFGEVKSEQTIFDYFHQLGVSTICLTKGKDGVVVSDIHTGTLYRPAIPLKEVKDSTGAGDAFWTGFLFARLHQKSMEECISVAQKLASIKLQNVGRLPDNIRSIEDLM